MCCIWYRFSAVLICIFVYLNNLYSCRCGCISVFVYKIVYKLIHVNIIIFCVGVSEKGAPFSNLTSFHLEDGAVSSWETGPFRLRKHNCCLKSDKCVRNIFAKCLVMERVTTEAGVLHSPLGTPPSSKRYVSL